jgi:predicted Zn-dependent peptidase
VEDVLRVANELLQRNRMAVSIVGPHRSDKQFAGALN